MSGGPVPTRVAVLPPPVACGSGRAGIRGQTLITCFVGAAHGVLGGGLENRQGMSCRLAYRWHPQPGSATDAMNAPVCALSCTPNSTPTSSGASSIDRSRAIRLRAAGVTAAVASRWCHGRRRLEKSRSG
jgi:hypothetical protein